MRKIDYEELTDKLIEEYPLESNPELYSMYTSMRLHLIKLFRLKNSTAIKLLLKIEEKMGIHFYRDYELGRMHSIGIKKANDTKRYFRALYLSKKFPLELVNAVYEKYGDVNCRLIKEFLKQNGQMSDDKFNKFNYAQQYYKSNKEEIKEKKRIYRQKKRLEREML